MPEQAQVPQVKARKVPTLRGQHPQAQVQEHSPVTAFNSLVDQEFVYLPSNQQKPVVNEWHFSVRRVPRHGELAGKAEEEVVFLFNGSSLHGLTLGRREAPFPHAGITAVWVAQMIIAVFVRRIYDYPLVAPGGLFTNDAIQAGLVSREFTKMGVRAGMNRVHTADANYNNEIDRAWEEYCRENFELQGMMMCDVSLCRWRRKPPTNPSADLLDMRFGKFSHSRTNGILPLESEDEQIDTEQPGNSMGASLDAPLPSSRALKPRIILPKSARMKSLTDLPRLRPLAPKPVLETMEDLGIPEVIESIETVTPIEYFGAPAAKKAKISSWSDLLYSSDLEEPQDRAMTLEPVSSWTDLEKPQDRATTLEPVSSWTDIEQWRALRPKPELPNPPFGLSPGRSIASPDPNMSISNLLYRRPRGTSMEPTNPSMDVPVLRITSPTPQSEDVTKANEENAMMARQRRASSLHLQPPHWSSSDDMEDSEPEWL